MHLGRHLFSISGDIEQCSRGEICFQAEVMQQCSWAITAYHLCSSIGDMGVIRQGLIQHQCCSDFADKAALTTPNISLSHMIPGFVDSPNVAYAH